MLLASAISLAQAVIAKTRNSGLPRYLDMEQTRSLDHPRWGGGNYPESLCLIALAVGDSEPEQPIRMPSVGGTHGRGVPPC